MKIVNFKIMKPNLKIKINKNDGIIKLIKHHHHSAIVIVIWSKMAQNSQISIKIKILH